MPPGGSPARVRYRARALQRSDAILSVRSRRRELGGQTWAEGQRVDPGCGRSRNHACAYPVDKICRQSAPAEGDAEGTPAVRDRGRLRRGVDIGSGVPGCGRCRPRRRSGSLRGKPTMVSFCPGMCDLRGEHTCARVRPRPADRCGVPGALLRPLRRLCQGKEGRPHGAGATLAHAATPAACSATIDTASPTSSATRGSVTW